MSNLLKTIGKPLEKYWKTIGKPLVSKGDSGNKGSVLNDLTKKGTPKMVDLVERLFSEDCWLVEEAGRDVPHLSDYKGFKRRMQDFRDGHKIYRIVRETDSSDMTVSVFGWDASGIFCVSEDGKKSDNTFLNQQFYPERVSYCPIGLREDTPFESGLQTCPFTWTDFSHNPIVKGSFQYSTSFSLKDNVVTVREKYDKEYDRTFVYGPEGLKTMTLNTGGTVLYVRKA
jgi:hypothetical protein